MTAEGKLDGLAEAGAGFLERAARDLDKTAEWTHELLVRSFARCIERGELTVLSGSMPDRPRGKEIGSPREDAREEGRDDGRSE